MFIQIDFKEFWQEFSMNYKSYLYSQINKRWKT